MTGTIRESARDIPVRGEYDVIVVGGGPAGTCAAAAAAQTGAKTLLVERYGFLGGMMTAGLVIGLHTDKLAPVPKFDEKKPIIGGIAQDILKQLITLGGAVDPDVWVQHTKIRSNYLPSDPELLKIASWNVVKKAGAELLAHAWGAMAIVDGKRVKGIFIESKSGREALLSKVVVDATGDGDIAASAGAEYRIHKKALPMTLMVTLAGVDLSRAKDYYPGSDELKQILNLAAKEGFRREAVLPERPVAPSLPMRFVWLPPAEMQKYWQRFDETHGWHSSYKGDCTDVADLTAAEIHTRESLVGMVSFLRRNVSGYERCYLSCTATQVGTRESRRIIGGYVLSLGGDIKSAAKHKDNICQGRRNTGDQVDQAGPAFDIPYRCLIPKEIDGLLTSGRCISMDHAAAVIIAIRDGVQSMGLGQAAGTAAAMAARQNILPRKLPVGSLQEELLAQGMNLWE